MDILPEVQEVLLGMNQVQLVLFHSRRQALTLKGVTVFAEFQFPLNEDGTAVATPPDLRAQADLEMISLRLRQHSDLEAQPRPEDSRVQADGRGLEFLVVLPSVMRRAVGA